jgi:hypothetical protein
MQEQNGGDQPNGKSEDVTEHCAARRTVSLYWRLYWDDLLTAALGMTEQLVVGIPGCAHRAPPSEKTGTKAEEVVASVPKEAAIPRQLLTLTKFFGMAVISAPLYSARGSR